jgi:hypothetical protein
MSSDIIVQAVLVGAKTSIEASSVAKAIRMQTRAIRSKFTVVSG